MADLIPIPIAGFHALDNPHLLTINQAQTLSDAWTDTDAVRRDACAMTDLFLEEELSLISQETIRA